MEMEMRATEKIQIGQDITPPLLPLAFSLFDSFLSSHCSCCFSPLPSHGHNPPFPPSFLTNSDNLPSLLYCSPSCSLFDSPLHLSSAEFYFLQSLPATSSFISSSDIRAALRLLHFVSVSSADTHRILGLLTNRHQLISEDSGVSSSIREGARAMVAARRRARGEEGATDEDDFVLEESVLCLIITNAVEVHDSTGCTLGIAIYDAAFSWINHSCSPNACYSFELSSPNATSSNENARKLRIVPQLIGNDSAEGENVNSCNTGFQQGRSQGYGPRLIVRSMKTIEEGEDVTISYTNLLQPKAMRQSELCAKYHFICCCRRCRVSPPAYVDHVLEGIYTLKREFTRNCSNFNFYRDEGDEPARKMSDYIEEAISEYLDAGDSESCCKKLEHMLAQGLLDEYLETKNGKSQLIYRLHPLHYLALNVYTTLSSGYKIRSSESMTLHSEADVKQLEAFDMNRMSTAYSLLLACATYHLFWSESSLILSAANFWTNAGESLIALASSSAWGLFTKGQSMLIPDLPSLAKHKCAKCLVTDILEPNLSYSQVPCTDFEEISSKFTNCVTTMVREVWSFLAHGCPYLEIFKNPIDFSWVGKSHNILDFKACLGSSSHERQLEAGCYANKRETIFDLGVHCSQFGVLLEKGNMFRILI